MTGCNVGPSVVECIAREAPNIEVLRISPRGVKLSKAFRKVEALCHKLRVVDLTLYTEEASYVLECLVNGCPNVERVCLEGNFEDLDITYLGFKSPRLRRLELWWTRITVDGLAALSRGCKYLEELHVHGCKQVTKSALFVAQLFPNLIVMEVNSFTWSDQDRMTTKTPVNINNVDQLWRSARFIATTPH